MSKEEWEDSGCICHTAPPCNKCMETCGECGGYFGEYNNEKCESCGVEM